MQTPDDILDRIRRIAATDFSLDPAGLDANVPLQSLDIDSLVFVEFLFKIEEEFGVSVSDEDMKTIGTLADLERCVVQALRSKQGSAS